MSVEVVKQVQYCAVLVDSPWVFPEAMSALSAFSLIVKGFAHREALSIR